MAAAWSGLARSRAGLARHAADWAGRLALSGDLAANLAQYCSEILRGTSKISGLLKSKPGRI
jgi:hypothetical protein